MDAKTAVTRRYSKAARQREASLCCPVDYDQRLLRALPEEILQKDYGCGDPSRYVRDGDVVLDLGCGGGKIAYMAAQLVGAKGCVIGVDMNDDMLALARSYQETMAQRLGGDRVRFVKGYIEDLALDLEALEAYLSQHPVDSVTSLQSLRAFEKSLRRERPLVADATVDVVISNCVLNLVDDRNKQRLIREIFRVLRPGGRIAISDIVADRPVPDVMKQDAELWSGCVSGAFEERAFCDAFGEAGFEGMTYDKWDQRPWQVVDGIEFRSVTMTAVKPPAARESQGTDRSLTYRGPFAQVIDEHGQRFTRGERVVVNAKRFALLSAPPYEDFFIFHQADCEDGSGSNSRCCG